MNLPAIVIQRRPSPPAPASTLRQALALAAEARRRGDHGAAACHELDALRALRQQLQEPTR